MTNHHLEEKVKNLEESNKQPNVVKTDTGDILMLCYECEYPAEDIYDLGEHMFEFHHEKEVEDINCNFCDDIFSTNEELQEHEREMHTEVWPCNFCSKRFDSKRNLMKQKKEKHIEKVSTCWNHSLGTCSFGERECWFSHTLESPVPEVKCKVCNETYLIKSEYQKHMKLKHSGTVKICRNITTNEECRYGDNCWFIHQQENKDGNKTFENNHETNNDMIKRMLEVMENVTERLAQLEEKK